MPTRDELYAEIAERLNLTVGTVRTRVHRGRLRLRALLESAQFVPPAARQGEADSFRKDRR